MAFRNYSNTAVKTFLSGAITDSATSLNLDNSTGYPSSNFTIAIENEVIFVGSRSGTTCSSLIRGFDNTTAAAHSLGETVELVVVAQDFTWWDVQRNLELGKTTTDTPDDDFDAGSLDGKWTVVDGSSGTVSMDPSLPVDVYDLTTRDELLVQVSSNNAFEIRQDYTLPDGNSIVMAFTPAINFADDSDVSYSVKLALNDNDTSHNSGTYLFLDANTNINKFRINYFDSSSNLVDNNPGTSDFGNRLYFRINRDGLAYTCYYSYTGSTWLPLRRQTFGSAFDNVWIQVVTDSSVTTRPAATTAIHWIRQGNNNIDPW